LNLEAFVYVQGVYAAVVPGVVVVVVVVVGMLFDVPCDII